MIKIDWNNIKNILIVLLIGVCIILVMSTTCSRQKLFVAENNIEALNDSLHMYELKNGELLYAKKGYISKIDELEKYIGIKEKEIKELERTLDSKVATISKLQEQIKMDSIHMNDSVSITHDVLTNDTTYHNYFNYADKWTSIDGETSFKLNPFTSHTIINNLSMKVPLKVGMTEDNQWFATSENPYVFFTSVEGANIQKTKQKRWGIGPTVIVGAGWGWGTDFNGNNIGGKGGLIVGFMAGFSIHYDIWQF